MFTETIHFCFFICANLNTYTCTCTCMLTPSSCRTRAHRWALLCASTVSRWRRCSANTAASEVLVLEFFFPSNYDETNPRPRAITTHDVLDHGDATRLHCKHVCPSFARAVPFIWSTPDGYLPRIRPLSKVRPRSGFDNPDIGPSLSLYHTNIISHHTKPCHEPICMTLSAT
jgi:hypothetical protein